MCAYANNQWNVEGELSDDPAQSSFRKALELAEGTVSILDRNGVVFSRVWCCYEIYVSLTRAEEEAEKKKEEEKQARVRALLEAGLSYDSDVVRSFPLRPAGAGEASGL